MKKLIPVVALLMASLSAHAEEAATPPDSEFSISLALGAAPRYEGARNYRALLFPYTSGYVRTQVGKFSLAGGGLAWTPLETRNFELGLVLAYDGGRKDSDSHGPVGGSAHLAGMGTLNGTAESGVQGIWHLGRVDLHATALHALGHNGHRGAHGELGASYGYALTEQLGGSLGLSTQWGDRSYNRAYFGVTPNQAAHTAFQVYEPGAGFKSVALASALKYRIDAHYSVGGMLSVSTLLGSDRHSPIVERRSALTAALGVGYTF